MYGNSKEFRDELKEFLEKHPYNETTVNGVKFRYVLSGDKDKPAVIFLNGLNMQEMWIKYVGALEADYRVLMFEYSLDLKTNQEMAIGLNAFLSV